MDPDNPLAMRRATEIGEEVAFGECDLRGCIDLDFGLSFVHLDSASDFYVPTFDPGQHR